MRLITIGITILAACGILAAQQALPRVFTEEGVVEGDPIMRALARDAIPAVDHPTFVSAAAAKFMQEDEPVIGVAKNGVAKAYSIWMLNAHEIVNDTIGSTPVAVTWQRTRVN